MKKQGTAQGMNLPLIDGSIFQGHVVASMHERARTREIVPRVMLDATNSRKKDVNSHLGPTQVQYHPRMWCKRFPL